MKNDKPKAKGTWGARDPRTGNELNAICNEFFNNLKLPREWKFVQMANVFDASIQSPANPNGTLLSVGKIYKDDRTSGKDFMQYRVFFMTYPERGGIVAKAIVDYGKFKYHCVTSNKTVEKLNEFIEERYKELKSDQLPTPDPPAPQMGGSESDQKEETNNELHDTQDGLQHFRDRFGD